MKRRPEDPKQLLIEWNRPADPPPPSAPANSKPEVRSPLIQRLPWDFKKTFPQPTDEALDAGVIGANDTKPENLKSLHENYARECLATLAALDKVLDARRRGVDPKTGQPARTHASSERLRKYFNDEPGRREHAFRVLIDTYGECFGEEASDAFEKAIRAWHAKIPVESNRVMQPKVELAKKAIGVIRVRRSTVLPVPKPLVASIAAGVFGSDEHGKPIRPTPQEVREITEAHAEKIIDMLLEDSKADIAQLVGSYTEDFGMHAGERLEAYCRRQHRQASQRAR